MQGDALHHSLLRQLCIARQSPIYRNFRNFVVCLIYFGTYLVNKKWENVKIQTMIKTII